jgi:hypothetical protein
MKMKGGVQFSAVPPAPVRSKLIDQLRRKSGIAPRKTLTLYWSPE